MDGQRNRAEYVVQDELASEDQPFSRDLRSRKEESTGFAPDGHAEEIPQRVQLLSLNLDVAHPVSSIQTVLRID